MLDIAALNDKGFVLIESLFNDHEIATIEKSIQVHLNAIGLAGDLHSRQIARNLCEDKQMQTALYNSIQSDATRLKVATDSKSFRDIARLLFSDPIIYSKCPLRIDVPHDLDQMTLWHQDYFYVKGNTDVYTLYVPLVDLDYISGSLSLLPGSHKLGPLRHCGRWGKKFYPTLGDTNAIWQGPIKAGSCLLFHSLLVHQTNPNYSEIVNWNIQFRISSKSKCHYARMGRVIPLS